MPLKAAELFSYLIGLSVFSNVALIGFAQELPQSAPTDLASPVTETGLGNADDSQIAMERTEPDILPAPKRLWQQSRNREIWDGPGLLDQVIQADALERNHVHKGTIGGKPTKHWWEKISIGGYTQVRYGKTLEEGPGAPPQLLGDRGIGATEGFTMRRARLKIQGDVAPHLGIYLQPDFAVTPPGSTDSTFFAQARDWYGDIYVDPDKVHRFRVGQSKLPYGFENMQSSQNRAPLDRSDPINSGVSPNERDLGVFYYWTPEDKQELFHDLQNARYKGSGNFGILGLGVFNGQGGSLLDANNVPHVVARLTMPFEVGDKHVCEVSVHGFCGNLVVQGTEIRALGQGPAIIPIGTSGNGGSGGIWEKHLGTTFVWYPTNLGLQSEWNVGETPALNNAQTEVISRPFYGGYVMALYAIETAEHGLFFPYTRWSQYQGGYSTQKNAPYGNSSELAAGIEWQTFKELEFTIEFDLVDRVNTSAVNKEGKVSYQNFDGSLLRLQCQFNY
ncbi:MAG: porin [Planctomycetota bacterium]|jgi:hypothetical protein